MLEREPKGMTENTNKTKSISELERAFYTAQQKAKEASNSQDRLMEALRKSKYAGIELPDDIVDVVDYGHASMSFERFIERMDEELKEMMIS